MRFFEASFGLSILSKRRGYSQREPGGDSVKRTGVGAALPVLKQTG
jgi:hypothetical protein